MERIKFNSIQVIKNIFIIYYKVYIYVKHQVYEFTHFQFYCTTIYFHTIIRDDDGILSNYYNAIGLEGLDDNRIVKGEYTFYS